MENLWVTCDGIRHIIHINETVWRLVADQHLYLTSKLFDSVLDQNIFDDLLEKNSSSQANKEFLHLHPLLAVPFKQPPLTFGSRFGKRSEQGIWYGSLQCSTALAEKAYYELVFLQASEKVQSIKKLFTAFSVKIETVQGINLTQPPFLKYKSKISSPENYEISQALGFAMRETKIEAICYESARDPEMGINIALFTPRAFAHKTPIKNSSEAWHCLVSRHQVEWTHIDAMRSDSKVFPADIFMVQGRFPFPPG